MAGKQHAGLSNGIPGIHSRLKIILQPTVFNYIKTFSVSWHKFSLEAVHYYYLEIYICAQEFYWLHFKTISWPAVIHGCRVAHHANMWSMGSNHYLIIASILNWWRNELQSAGNLHEFNIMRRMNTEAGRWIIPENDNFWCVKIDFSPSNKS